MRQMRATAIGSSTGRRAARSWRAQVEDSTPTRGTTPIRTSARTGSRRPENGLQREAWHWAVTNRSPDGSLPSGKAIADHFGRHERWGRLIKQRGEATETAFRADGTAA